MDVLWIFVFACVLQCISAERLSDVNLPHGESPDIFFKLMEKFYSPSTKPTGNEERLKILFEKNVDPGKPLILTPLIKQNKLAEARAAARVDSDVLPPGYESYAGYLTVNKKYNANLWFWYFPVRNMSVEHTPWITWLQGGPGVSSLFGLFEEIGPFSVDDKYDIHETNYSWSKSHSLLFIDNPVGAGFSFADDRLGYSTNQTAIGENLYSALQQFLTVFPELRRAPLTIAGESYAGKHIPSLGIQILRHRNKDEHINLQGLAIGDGFIDPLSLQRYSYFVREVGLVDDKTADFIKKLEANVTYYINKGEMLDAYRYYNRILYLIEYNNDISVYNYLQTDTNFNWPFIHYVKRNDVRRALHVGANEYNSVNWLVHAKLSRDFMTSAKAWLEELLNNYRVMLYNGQLDVIVAYHCSVNTHNSLVFNGSKQFREYRRRPWYHNDSLAGYYRTGGNLIEVMVRNAGHMVPADQPAAAFGLISAFTRGQNIDYGTYN